MYGISFNGTFYHPSSYTPRYKWYVYFVLKGVVHSIDLIETAYCHKGTYEAAAKLDINIIVMRTTTGLLYCHFVSWSLKREM